MDQDAARFRIPNNAVSRGFTNGDLCRLGLFLDAQRLLEAVDLQSDLPPNIFSLEELTW